MNTCKPIIFIACAVMFTACNSKPAKQTQVQSPAVNAVGDSATWPKPTTNPAIKDGLNITRYSNGVVRMKGYYKNSKRVGEWQSFYPSGKLWSDEYFADGLPDGNSVVYYENGQKMYEGAYHNGVTSGIWHYWDEKGKLIRTADYSKKPANSPL